MSRPWQIPPARPTEPTPSEALLFDSYTSMRLDLIAIEQLLESGGWSEEDQMRLDRAVTVMKVGAKLIKKVLLAHGYSAPSRKAKSLAKRSAYGMAVRS